MDALKKFRMGQGFCKRLETLAIEETIPYPGPCAARRDRGRGEKPRHRKLPSRRGNEPDRDMRWNVLRHGVPGQRRCQMAGSRGVFALPQAGCETAKSRPRSRQPDRAGAAEGWLSEHLFHCQRARYALFKPAGSARTVLRRSYDRGCGSPEGMYRPTTVCCPSCAEWPTI